MLSSGESFMDKNKTSMKAFQAQIFGRVQGVGFRYSTLAKAKSLSITGYVRNMADGSVEVIAEGDAETLRIFLDWLQHGPPGAIVRNLNFHYRDYTGTFGRFTIEY
jgi:acylphosphatase